MDLGDVNITNVNYDGGDFSATSYSSNQQPIDPVSTIYVSEVSQYDYTRKTESVDVNTFSSNSFSGDSFQHTVGTLDD